MQSCASKVRCSMAQKISTEHERTLVGVYVNLHTDTVGRFSQGLNVRETTRRAIEDACHELGLQHIVIERMRALAAKDGES